MAARILVTGGTGTLGRQVVPRLREAGGDVRVLSRRTREANGGVEYVTGDLATGQGVQAAVAGAAIIVHCAGSARGDEDKARNLVRAASQAGTPHLVNISVVGADRIPVASAADRVMFGYFAAKLAAERVVAGSDLPWTTLRATQFYDLILMVARQLTRLPAVPAAVGFRFQPVDTGEVAARLADLGRLPGRADSWPSLTGGHPTRASSIRWPLGACRAGAGRAPAWALAGGSAGTRRETRPA
jgi:uncharacterized protein YbjT (DUF2867 family)